MNYALKCLKSSYIQKPVILLIENPEPPDMDQSTYIAWYLPTVPLARSCDGTLSSTLSFCWYPEYPCGFVKGSYHSATHEWCWETQMFKCSGFILISWYIFVVSTRTSYTLLLLYMIRVAYLASALDRARAMSGTIRFWDLPGAILGGAPMSWGPVDVYFGVYVRIAGIGMPATISQVIAVLSSNGCGWTCSARCITRQGGLRPARFDAGIFISHRQLCNFLAWTYTRCSVESTPVAAPAMSALQPEWWRPRLQEDFVAILR